MFSLYRNNGDESFRDDANRLGVAQATRLLSGWGLKFFDYDNDGYLDLLLANGHPDDMVAQHTPTVTYAEPLLLFEQQNGKLLDVSGQAGPVFQKHFPARALAVGDYDNDGRLDVSDFEQRPGASAAAQPSRRGQSLGRAEAGWTEM